MAANVDAMLRAAIDAYKKGDKASARTLLDRILEVDEYNENAWLWMSASVDTPDEQRTCLENVLVINPNNEKARKGLKSLGFDPDATTMVPPPAPPAAAAPAFTDTSFAAPASTGSVWDDDDDAPPTASSSASSSSFRGSNVSANDLDSWISGMGIGSTAKQPALSPASNPFSASSFDEDEDPSFDDFDDRMSNMFNEDEFDAPEPPPAAKPPAAPGRPAAQATRPAAPPAFTAPSIFDEDDEVSPFDDDEPSDGVTDEDFDEFSALIDEPEPEPALPPVRATGTARAVSRGSDYAVQEEQFEDEDSGPDPAQLFAMIPKEIEVSSRLPGEDEESPRSLIIGVGFLVVMNVLALAFLLMNMM